MELYHAAASPFARKVRVVLHETGQTDDVTLVESAQTPLTPNAANQNPLGKIPCLTRDDGPALYDSRVICRYLNDRAQAQLYPTARQWEVLTLEATADGIMDAAVLMVYEARVRPEDKQFAAYVEAQWGKVTRALDAIEDRWLSHLSGPVDIGQIGIACALGYLDFRHGARDWRQGRDGLATWEKAFLGRASMAATMPT
ncbi:putative GST-like protein YibF [Rhodobacteraceae bacterium THAF1]|uniref:glutathione S-transferase n=1 Tax=Palleronia sp. THAF1 TaxID=2587842 RepID=UPI000F402BD4|nr:glutathione S-transferase [Palleronia sp. THAF1]QFU07259.1 putative GST-like protein YibF [Palleronia sp. THAF1]VDC20829.1 putative GST-like protein YibF [Rhodobacteraceae bacterium THAF1]